MLILLLGVSHCLSVTCNSRKGQISDETVLGKRRFLWIVFYLKKEYILWSINILMKEKTFLHF